MESRARSLTFHSNNSSSNNNYRLSRKRSNSAPSPYMPDMMENDELSELQNIADESSRVMDMLDWVNNLDEFVVPDESEVDSTSEQFEEPYSETVSDESESSDDLFNQEEQENFNIPVYHETLINTQKASKKSKWAKHGAKKIEKSTERAEQRRQKRKRKGKDFYWETSKGGMQTSVDNSIELTTADNRTRMCKLHSALDWNDSNHAFGMVSRWLAGTPEGNRKLEQMFQKNADNFGNLRERIVEVYGPGDNNARTGEYKTQYLLDVLDNGQPSPYYQALLTLGLVNKAGGRSLTKKKIHKANKKTADTERFFRIFEQLESKDQKDLLDQGSIVEKRIGAKQNDPQKRHMWERLHDAHELKRLQEIEQEFENIEDDSIASEIERLLNQNRREVRSQVERYLLSTLMSFVKCQEIPKFLLGPGFVVPLATQIATGQNQVHIVKVKIKALGDFLKRFGSTLDQDMRLWLARDDGPFATKLRELLTDARNIENIRQGGGLTRQLLATLSTGAALPQEWLESDESNEEQEEKALDVRNTYGLIKGMQRRNSNQLKKKIVGPTHLTCIRAAPRNCLSGPSRQL